MTALILKLLSKVGISPLIAKLIGLAIVAAALFFAGFWSASKIKDRAMAKYKTEQTNQAALVAQQYTNKIKSLNERINSLKSQSADTSKDAQKTVTKYIDVLVPQVVKDNPQQFQCVVPAQGMQILQNSAKELNATRGGIGGH